MASNPLFMISDFFCIFQTNLAMATLGLKEMEKFLWQGDRAELFPYLPKGIFPFPSNLK